MKYLPQYMYIGPKCTCDILILHSDFWSKVCLGMFPPYALIDSGLLLTVQYFCAGFELELCSVVDLMDELETLFDERYWNVSNEEE